MQLANQQKVIVVVSSLVVVALLVTTIWSRPGFLYKPPTQTEVETAQQKTNDQLAAYNKYLATIEADPKASYEIISSTIDYPELKKQVTADLGANKPALEPKIDSSKFKVSQDVSESAVQAYLTAVSGYLKNYNAIPTEDWDAVLSATPDPVLARTMQGKSSMVITDMYNLSVPRTAVPLHTSLVRSLVIQAQLISDAVKATVAVLPRGEGRWINTYPVFRAAQLEKEKLDGTIEDLQKQYVNIFAPREVVTTGAFGVKVAKAFPVEVITDLPRFWEQMLRTIIGQVVLNYMRNQILTWVTRFDKDHTIANFLYYGDALVNKNTDDYIKKYATDELGFDAQDRKIVKDIMPKLNCGRLDEEKFRKDLRVKVLTHLGFDPAQTNSLDPNDPDYYTKLSKVATLRGDPSGRGYELFYSSLASVVAGESSQAALVEQLSSGKKAGYGTDGTKKILQSVDLVSAKITGAINSIFNLAPTNATTGGPAWSGVVTGLIVSVLTQLSIQGTVTLKEQATCIKTAVYSPVIPGDFSPSKLDPDQEYIGQCVINPQSCGQLVFNNPNSAQ